jgi:hypothetical protein
MLRKILARRGSIRTLCVFIFSRVVTIEAEDELWKTQLQSLLRAAHDNVPLAS